MATLQPGQSIRPNVSANQAKQLAFEYFGCQVSKIKELNSYDDRNFYIEAANGKTTRKFILKVLNSMDSRKPHHIEAEHAVMFYLASKGVKCPVPEQNLEGKTYSIVPIPSEDFQNANSQNPEAGVPIHLIRLLSFVEGKILYDVPISAKLLNKTGAYIAEIEEYLKAKECQNPVLETHSSIWMLSHVTELEKFIYVIKDKPERFELVSRILDAYRVNVLPVISQLEKGVIHGDYNEQNILVQPSEKDIDDYDISGLIDFGDLQVSPYAFELAITICYMMLESVRCGIVDPFEAAGHVLAGYSKLRTIGKLELELMRTLIACRLCQSLVMGAYTSAQDPGNEYLLTTAGRGWTLLDQIWNGKTDEELLSIWKPFLQK